MTIKIHEDGEGGAAPSGVSTTSAVGNVPGTETGYGITPPKNKKLVRRKVSMKEFLEMQVVDESVPDKEHPIVKEYDALKKQMGNYSAHLRESEGSKMIDVHEFIKLNSFSDYMHVKSDGAIDESDLHRAVSSGMKDLLVSGDHVAFKKVAVHLGHAEWQTHPGESDLAGVATHKLQQAHAHMYKGRALGESVELTEATEYSFLSKSGFKKKGSLSDGGAVHSHPLHGDVIINKHGHWHHVPSGSTREGGFEGTTGASLQTHLGRLRESVEHLDEVEVAGADRYAFSHGKKPAGTGTWFFSKHKSVDFGKHKEGIDHISVRGTYGEAKKKATTWAKEQGHAVIHVQP